MNTIKTAVRVDEGIKRKLDMLALEDYRCLNSEVIVIFIEYLERIRNEKDR